MAEKENSWDAWLSKFGYFLCGILVIPFGFVIWYLVQWWHFWANYR